MHAPFAHPRSPPRPVCQIVSFDVVIEASGIGFQIPFALCKLVPTSQIFIKLGCFDSGCASWAGVGGVSMFDSFDWVPNEDPNYLYSTITAQHNDLTSTSPIPSTTNDHVVLTINDDAVIDEEEVRRPQIYPPAHTHTCPRASHTHTCPRASAARACAGQRSGGDRGHVHTRVRGGHRPDQDQDADVQ